jgi:putative tricarboxylic transport membrane protein
MLVIINMPLIGLWVKLLQVPYRLMFPAILTFCCIGIYSIQAQPADIFAAAFFGICGYTLIKLGYEPAPLLLGFVLGKLMEENLVRSVLISRGDWMTFINKPISAVLLVIAVVMIVLALLPSMNSKRDAVFTE